MSGGQLGVNTSSNASKQRVPRLRGRRATRIFLYLYLACWLLPLTVIVAWSFTEYWPWPELLPQSFSMRGLEELFNGHAPIGGILLQSIVIAIATSIICCIVGSLAARALAHHSFTGKQLFHFATLLPFLVPATVFAMGIQVAFIKLGLANTISGVVIAHTVVALPYAIVILTDVTKAAGLRNEEQARVLGANTWQVLREVTIPSLMPGILSAASMSYIVSFSQYFLTLLVGGGTVKTLATVMFPYLASGDRTIASAYGLLFLAVTFAVFLLFEFILKRLGLREPQDYFN